MSQLTKKIRDNTNIDKSINNILQELCLGTININQLISSIKQNSDSPCEVLNKFGVTAYQEDLNDYVFPFFEASYEINPNHKDTLINMGAAFNMEGEYKLALQYLEKIQFKDENVLSLINIIKGRYMNPKRKLEQKLKFALRRIENNIDVEGSREQVYQMMHENAIKTEDILEAVRRHVIKKDVVLNSVGVKFYEKGLYEDIIPIFQKAYEYNNDNFDVIYNLGNFLYQIGEKRLALKYFEKIEKKDKEIDKLTQKIRRKLNE